MGKLFAELVSWKEIVQEILYLVAETNGFLQMSP